MLIRQCANKVARGGRARNCLLKWCRFFERVLIVKFIVYVAALAFSTSVQAADCPWGGKAFTAATNNGKILLRPNAACSKLLIGSVTDPSDADEIPMAFDGRHWVAPPDGDDAIMLDMSGRTVQLKLGARRERMG